MRTLCIHGFHFLVFIWAILFLTVSKGGEKGKYMERGSWSWEKKKNMERRDIAFVCWKQSVVENLGSNPMRRMYGDEKILVWELEEQHSSMLELNC